MVLKKPSDYFKKEILSVNDSVQELVKTPELSTFSDAFESFKKNLNKIEMLSEFSETLDNYRVNVERVNHLSEKVEDIQTDIQRLLKKEDLDRAMMSQLLIVEQSIRDVQGKVKGINEKNLTEIRLDVSSLTKTVSEFIEFEVPKYKKLVVDTELRTNNRYEELEQNVNSTLEGIGEFVDKKYDELTETLQGINERSLAGIIEDFKTLDKSVLKLKEEEIPKYKGFLVESERKTEAKLESFDQKLNKTLVTFDEKIDETVSNVLDKIDSAVILNVSIEKNVNQKIEEVQNLQKRVNNEIKNVEEKKEELSKKVTDLEVEIIRNESHIRSQNDYIESIQEEITKKVANLENEIVRNESQIESQNQYIENIQEEVREVISKLHIEELEEQNYELSKKIKYLEEVFEKFNSETLTEGLLNEPPTIKNDDPLTPLDKNFVTLDQLQEHYRLFINRIQQQLSTIGGGGETRLKYLDDVVGIATNASAYDGKFLKYNHNLGKFEFETVSGGGESYWVQGLVGIVTTSNVGINTNNPTSTLTVNGDALVVGVLTATDFNSASDIKLKDNVSVIDNPLDKIVKLEGVNFSWKETGKKSLGVIAQEVEKVLPELVSGEESKTVNYNGLVGLLIECVKQQQKEIDELRRLIDK